MVYEAQRIDREAHRQLDRFGERDAVGLGRGERSRAGHLAGSIDELDARLEPARARANRHRDRRRRALGERIVAEPRGHLGAELRLVGTALGARLADVEKMRPRASGLVAAGTIGRAAHAAKKTIPSLARTI